MARIADELKLKDKREFNSALVLVDMARLMRMAGIWAPLSRRERTRPRLERAVQAA